MAKQRKERVAWTPEEVLALIPLCNVKTGTVSNLDELAEEMVKLGFPRRENYSTKLSELKNSGIKTAKGVVKIPLKDFPRGASGPRMEMDLGALFGALEECFGTEEEAQAAIDAQNAKVAAKVAEKEKKKTAQVA